MKCFIVFLSFTWIHFVCAGYINSNGLGTECLYDEDCITRNSFCKGNKICSCKIGYQYDPGSDVCFPTEVGLKCDEDYDCSALKNSICVFRKCQCKIDHVSSRDRSSCLPSMKLTSVCEEDPQCNSVMNGSYCDPISRRCLCKLGFKQDPYQMQCIPAKLPKCKETSDCEINPENRGKVVCKTIPWDVFGTCVCAEGYKEINETCYKDGSSRAALSLPTIIFAFLLVKWLL